MQIIVIENSIFLYKDDGRVSKIAKWDEIKMFEL